MVQVITNPDIRIRQGDVFSEIEFIEYAQEETGIIEVSKILFPLVIVLTQDCDLEQDYKLRWSGVEGKSQDKWLLSVLVAPLYNIEHVYNGEQLSELDYEMQHIPKKGTHGNFLRTNQIPRYHYLEFPETVKIVPSIVDFKHYFSVNVKYLHSLRQSDFVCSVSELFREDISHRFACFLSRIGLPEFR